MKILTFNIRNGNADDGNHSWEHRRHITAKVIGDAGADIVCLQEVFAFQLDYLLEQLQEYAVYSVGRDDGEREGEACSILWRKSRFAPLDQGTFWLSDTPDQPRSTSWGNRTTRICSWVDFGTFALFNTHWDHESQPAREKSANLIHRHLPLTPWLVVGDLNAEPSSEEVLALPGILHTAGLETGTFHNFQGGVDGEKIDHVLSAIDFRCTRLQVIDTCVDGLWPSDHYPVLAEIE